MNPKSALDPARIIALVALAAAIALTYGHTLDYPFIFDDIPNIEANQHIRMNRLSWSALQEACFDAPVRGRPIAYLTFALNYWVGGLNVVGFHAVNIGIHFLASFIVYLLADITLQLYRATEGIRVGWLDANRRLYVSLLTALIFALHPIQIQSVTYMVQRMNSLAAMLYLLALWLYIMGRIRPAGTSRLLFFISAVLVWGLSLGSKQIAVVWPITVLLYEWFFFQNLSVRWLRRGMVLLSIAFALLLGIAIVQVKSIETILDVYSVREFTLEERLLTQPRVLATYARLVLVPFPSQFNLLHDVSTSRSMFDPPTTFLAMLLLIGYSGIAVAMAVRSRLLSFCLLWPLINLVVESSVIPLEMIYEHRMYLPMFGISLAISYVTGRFLLRQPIASWVVVLAVVVAGLGISTFVRNMVWRDPLVLWTDVIAKSPRLPRPLVNRGSAHANHSDWPSALADYQKATQDHPMFDMAWVGRGLGRLNTGQPAQAIDDFTKAGQRAQTSDVLTTCYRHRASAWASTNNLSKAVEDYQRALAYEPGDTLSRFNLANALRRLGRYDEAVTQYQQCIQDRPDIAGPYNNLAALWTTHPDASKRQAKQAIELATRACELTNWKDWNTLDTLAAAYAEDKQFAKAAQYQGQAATLAPSSETAGLRRLQERYARKAKSSGNQTP